MLPTMLTRLASTPEGIVCAAFALGSPAFFVLEYTEALNFGYSKFAERSKIDCNLKMPSRLGMFWIYFPAALTYAALAIYLRGAEALYLTNWHLTCFTLMTLHFVKRLLEVLFLHKYSGSIGAVSVMLISPLYTVIAGIIAIAATLRFPAGSEPEVSALGVAVWAAGQFGNFYHHWLLAGLRSGGEKQYKVPRGGLFGFCCCPHYTCELVAWFGFCLVFVHAEAYCLTLTMTMYLCGRAPATLNWYREKGLEDLPAGWKSIVPLVW